MLAVLIANRTGPRRTNTATAALRTRAPPRPRECTRLLIDLSVSGDIDRPAFAVDEREPRLSAGDRSTEREAPQSALESIDRPEAPGRVGPRRAEGLPMAAVVDEQLDHHP